MLDESRGVEQKRTAPPFDGLGIVVEGAPAIVDRTKEGGGDGNGTVDWDGCAVPHGPEHTQTRRADGGRKQMLGTSQKLENTGWTQITGRHAPVGYTPSQIAQQAFVHASARFA